MRIALLRFANHVFDRSNNFLIREVDAPALWWHDTYVRIAVDGMAHEHIFTLSYSRRPCVGRTENRRRTNAAAVAGNTSTVVDLRAGQRGCYRRNIRNNFDSRGRCKQRLLRLSPRELRICRAGLKPR